MSKYVVHSGQNLYDVALYLYGSIEGIVDLFLNNPWLSFDCCLKKGDELIYTEDFVINQDVVTYNNVHGIIPANGERNVYFKDAFYPALIDIRLRADVNSAGFFISGKGVIEVDWGDNSQLEVINLPIGGTHAEHYFNSSISSELRNIRLYGEVEIRSLDFNKLFASGIYLLRPVYIEKLRVADFHANIDFLALADGLFELDLTGIRTSSLLPLLQDKALMKLDLRSEKLKVAVIDHFLIALVNQYEERRNCEIRLSVSPLGVYREPERDENGHYTIGTGMEAIWVIVHEPAWNEGGSWKFIINQTVYSNEPDN